MLTALSVCTRPTPVRADEAEGSASAVTFLTDVHFTAPDGSDVVVAAARYRIEAGESSIRLQPLDGGEPVVVSAESSTHDQSISEPTVLVDAGDTDDTQGLVYLALFLPDGRHLTSVGSTTGIATRGKLANAWKNRPRPLKKVVRASGVKETELVQTIAQNKVVMLVSQVASNVAAAVDSTITVKLENADVVVDSLGAVWERAKNAPCETAMGVCIKALDFVQSKAPATPTGHFLDQPNVQSAYAEAARTFIESHFELIRIAAEMQATLDEPGHRERLDRLFEPGVFCSTNPAAAWSVVDQCTGATQHLQEAEGRRVATRGESTFGEWLLSNWSFSIMGGADVGARVGLNGGLGFAFGFADALRSPEAAFVLSGGEQHGAVLGVEGGVQFGFWHRSPRGLHGLYYGKSVGFSLSDLAILSLDSLPTWVGASVAVYFSPPTVEQISDWCDSGLENPAQFILGTVQGVVISFSASASLLPVTAVKQWGWTLTANPFADPPDHLYAESDEKRTIGRLLEGSLRLTDIDGCIPGH